MAIAKNPGAGQGKGGGRPRGKTREVEEVRLRLSPQAADLLRTMAESKGTTAWAIVEGLLMADMPEPAPVPEMPTEAQEIAQEAREFLDGQVERPAALKALRRAWGQALALANKELSKPHS